MRRLMLALLAMLMLAGLTVAPAQAEGPIVGDCTATHLSGPWNQIWWANIDDGHLYGTMRVYQWSKYPYGKCVVLNKTDLYGTSSFVAVGIKRWGDSDSTYVYDGNYYTRFAGPALANVYPQAGWCMTLYWDYYGSGGHHYAGQIPGVACN